MKFLDEYRDEALAAKLVDEIRHVVTKSWVLMEVCGGQTHSIVKYGIDRLLPDELELVHGPGCPVCARSLEMIDKAHAIAARSGVIFCSFGDMLRVPGSDCDLLMLKSRGADVRVVYSPIDCLKIARANPEKKVVFFAIGFETTAPANAMSVFQASALTEIAQSAKLGMLLDEAAIPISEEVKGACEILGLDPLYVANEGKFIAIVAHQDANRAVETIRTHSLGKHAAVIGEVVDEHAGLIMMKTRVGGMRVVDMLSGEQLPRIC